MAIRKIPLDGLSSDYASLVAVPKIGYNVYHATKPHVLFQAAGYLKHVRAKVGSRMVFFRGQRTLYPTIPPTLYRGLRTEKGRGKRDAEMQSFLKSIRKRQNLFRAVDEHVQEPLLQHYGLKTRWLDVIDNVWIALWFACHTAYGFGSHGQYLHFEKR